jgi:RND family efflux transporter MFP subunit
MAGPKWRSWLSAAGFGALVAVATAGGVAALYARAAAPEAAAVAIPPVPVTVARLALADGYEAVDRLVGRIEPARETRASFERGGLVSEVLVDEGDRVTAGQPLARLDVAALALERERLAAARAAAEADLALARSTLERRAALTRQGHATGQSLDEARFSEASLEARLREIAAQEAQVALDIDKAEVRAPFDAVVAARLVDEGAVVAPGAGVARLQEVGRPRARIGAPVERARDLEPGMVVALDTAAGPVSARLVSISPDVDPVTRTVALRFDVDPAASPAMGDVVRLDLSRLQPGRGAWAPVGALREGVRGLWALSLVAPDADGFVTVETAVEVLHLAGDRAFVRGPFADGALAVAAGPSRLAPGQRVTPVAETAPQTVAGAGS